MLLCTCTRLASTYRFQQRSRNQLCWCSVCQGRYCSGWQGRYCSVCQGRYCFVCQGRSVPLYVLPVTCCHQCSHVTMLLFSRYLLCLCLVDIFLWPIKQPLHFDLFLFYQIVLFSSKVAKKTWNGITKRVHTETDIYLTTKADKGQLSKVHTVIELTDRVCTVTDITDRFIQLMTLPIKFIQ